MARKSNHETRTESQKEVSTKRSRRIMEKQEDREMSLTTNVQEEPKKKRLNTCRNTEGLLENNRHKSIMEKRTFTNPHDAEKKYPSIKPYKIGETSDNKVLKEESDDEIEEECEDEEDNDADLEGTENYLDEGDDFYDENHKEKDSSFYNRLDNGFSISGHLGNTLKEESVMDRLKKAVQTGSAYNIGSTIREGFASKSLTDVQIEELCSNVEKPKISLLQFFIESEEATEKERADIAMGQMFLTKLAMFESKAVTKLKASVNSLASSFSSQTKVALLTKKTLGRPHIIEETGAFPKVNLVNLYDKFSLVGDTAFSQMTYFLTRVFKNVLTPKYAIWMYTYRPKCIRPTDKHFKLFPEDVAEKLIDFAYDIIGIYLPVELLHGPIDLNNQFIEELDCLDQEKEIVRRRNEREMVSQTMQSSIGQMLNYLRDQHFDLQTGQLESCKTRKTCTSHLTWKDVKLYRDNCRLSGDDPENFDPQSIIGYATRSTAQNQHHT